MSARNPGPLGAIDPAVGGAPIGPILEAAFGEAVTAVPISLSRTGGTPTLVVEDDGAGFEAQHRAVAPGSGMSLLCVEQRARLLDGTVRIESSPGRGTAVRGTLPVPAPESPPVGPEGVAARGSEGRR